ncbi:bifunctional folylpolyglutamate synthase/dihydrofolate synthase [Nitratifractor sp.]|uniref:bifunctional folylpolyglutamate synthase/dihydrofolate synthase n=1 Tax=Nitratifractor sp. TaxID=2268144 RepID=UPI0025F1B9B4|nr:bifunctional folylpolyglutamate synthase/dihydrofolate synthase [Nitratifractor sp.]
MIPPFSGFLESKPLYYKEIDHERVHRAYARLRDHIAHPPAVHIVGTNGKGSTGRMLAFLAWQNGMEDGKWKMENGLSQSESTNHFYPLPTTHYPLSVGHYSSPHILRFNERIWIDGENVSDEVLEEGHRRLYGILGAEMSEALSYFEYTTLLALLLFERCDLIILEAGLGGEFDATNVVENKRLTVVTPIGIDHQAFLGDSIEAIAETKLRSITPHTQVLLAPQAYAEVESVARRIANERGCGLTMEDGRWKMEELERALQNKAWPEFLHENASVALRALEFLGISGDVEALKDLELFGRFYPIAENVRIDVGHNPLAARAIARAMEPETVLIYNSLDDKDYREVLSILRPKLKRVEILPIESQRAATLREIEEALAVLEIPWDCFSGQLFSHERYLVFGSFYTVEAFLKSQDLGYNQKS